MAVNTKWFAKEGKKRMAEGGKEGLSKTDKPSHDTRKIMAEELGWGTNKLAIAECRLYSIEITLNKE